jgi:RNA polymerase sigma-70 factor (ECF subfamily)
MDKQICDNLDQRIRDGEHDEGLFEAIAECLGDEIRRFALARCGNTRSDVEDISQDALLAAQRYLNTFRGDASLRTWLYRLVLSACSRQRRGRKNDPTLHQSLEDHELPPDGKPGRGEDPEAALIMNERLDALQQAIEALRPQDKKMLAAVEWQGLSLAQVAEQHAMTVSAVKSRMFRIRQQLKERVSARLTDEDQQEVQGQ